VEHVLEQVEVGAARQRLEVVARDDLDAAGPARLPGGASRSGHVRQVDEHAAQVGPAPQQREQRHAPRPRRRRRPLRAVANSPRSQSAAVSARV
jgi:hypothetical protein